MYVSEPTNVALGRPTFQWRTRGGRGASLAVDATETRLGRGASLAVDATETRLGRGASLAVDGNRNSSA